MMRVHMHTDNYNEIVIGASDGSGSDGTDDATSTWTTERVLVLSIGAAASLILAFRALRVLNENWQDPLTEAERKSLREPKLTVSSVRVEVPGA